MIKLTPTIDAGIPIPETRGPRGLRSGYPFEAMLVNDSFFVPGKTAESLTSCSRYWALKLKYKYLFRSVDGGVRVWRIA